ncbi:MAG: tetratricopeptide repeat protein, partial [Bdellovibrionaceae bacterium]|nr:tetratricopeptide repeat protein [Pseudobdellovibrionaceae bacterium]
MTHNNDNNIQKMESLQIELQSNPKSLSFAQLADLYLAQNMIADAETLLLRSLKYHPASVSGHMLLGRVYQLKNEDQKALDHFNICLQKAPTNWTCYLLRAQMYLKLQKPKLALQDFKQVMLHNPQHMGVQKSIIRLESLTADEYEEDLFEIKNINQIAATTQTYTPVNASTAMTSNDSWAKINPRLERVLSLVDAFVTRQDYDKAIKLLRECQSEFGDQASNINEIQARLLKLSQFETVEKLRPKEAAHISISKQS